MKKILPLCLLILLIRAYELIAQNERIFALGSTTVALKDFDLDLNLYDFGKNVAYLSEDRRIDFLLIKPGFNYQSGDYRRFFDYERASTYSLAFDGTKILKDGAFRGFIIYEVESRQNVNRALNRYPYTGIPFFITDTTSGDFIYNGPKVGFQYSFELIKSFLFGFELNYQLVDGLKSIYSRAKSLWRNIDGSINLAYKFSDDFIIGGKISGLDKKESIEAKSEDLFDADIFNYRGDTYSFRRRGQTIEQTYREKGITYSAQSIITPLSELNIGMKIDYVTSFMKTYYPYGMLKQYEEGHSVFENYFFDLKMNYTPLKNLLIGFETFYESNNSWSRISELALMIWKWNLKRYNVGSGFSYRFDFAPLILVSEFHLGKIISDSSKYIDNKYVNHNDNYLLLKAGLEFEILKQIFLRTGFQNGKLGFDTEKGGKDVTFNKLTFGFGIYSFKNFGIDYFIEYGIIGNNLAQKNKVLYSQLALKLYNF